MTNDLKERTKRFALEVVRFCSALNSGSELRAISNQLVRSGTSTGANYRAACRSKSKANFINKLSIVEEEAGESEYWSELLESLAPPKTPERLRLKDEAHQSVAIMIQSRKTARSSIAPARTGDSEFVIRNS